MSKIIKAIRALEGEIVEIQWTTKDGNKYYERHSIPPKSVREAREAEKRSNVLIDEEGSER